MRAADKGSRRVFVCKPHYPDTTHIVWEDERRLRRAPEDGENESDIKKKKGGETKAGWRDGGKQGRGTEGSTEEGGGQLFLFCQSLSNS